VLLEGRTAIVYGGGGSIGGAVSRVFAREGASVHLAGRTLGSLEEVAEEIRAAGGAAEVAQVDALDESAVDEHADAVAGRAGGIDVCLNAISLGDVHGTPMVEMSLELFERPIRNAVRSTFLTSRAVARHMVTQGSGVILIFGGGGGRDPIRDYCIGGFQVALGAADYMRRQLAAELGQHGVRVVTLESGGILDSIPEDYEGRDRIVELVVEPTMLGRAATLEDVGNVAAFAASDQARAITGSALNITCGATAN
jgi:3-oxoacyl-[acyl-carrier protein] reductase